MIPYINTLLDQWGLWARTGRERLGYPKQSSFMRLAPPGGGAGSGSVIVCDDEAMRINRAVQSLDPELRTLVELFYIRMRSCDAGSIAKAQHCCRDTVYARLHRAHVRVMEFLQDEEIGIARARGFAAA